MSPIAYQILLGMLMMTTTLSGFCVTEDLWVEVPGDDEYGTQFEIDWSVFDSGTYSYGPEGSTVRQVGGGRSGYLAFYDLTLDFSFKDGRRYSEIIDVNALMRKLIKKIEVFDNRNTRWGGSATLLITIHENELMLNYRISERTLEPDYELTYYYYPLYKKKLG